MPLFSSTFGQGGRNSRHHPTVVFLHGFLGSTKDWSAVIHHVSQTHQCIAIDLPGHGNSRAIRGDNFDHIQTCIAQTLVQRGITQAVFVGYSLGARVLMNIVAHPNRLWRCKMVGVMLEGGHFGLDETVRESRLHSDQQWAKHFRDRPIDEVLQAWYQQSVFGSLTDQQRQVLIQKRQHNRGECVAEMLEAASLAKQQNLLPQLQRSSIPLHYVCGGKDKKFQQIATKSQLALSIIESAGHNVHIEQPELFSQQLLHYLAQVGD